MRVQRIARRVECDIVRQAHRQFLETYGVSATDYPLVGLSYDNPEQPFYALDW